MRLTRFICMLPLMAAATLAACAPMAGGAPPGRASDPVREQAIQSAADTSAAIMDALAVAPAPRDLTAKVTIDDKVVRAAFLTFEASLSVIDLWVANGSIVRNSPFALRLKRGVDATDAALRAASSAQRIGDAGGYKQALSRARTAWDDVQLALALGR